MNPEESSQLLAIEERKYIECCECINIYQNKIAEFQSERQNKCVLVENKQEEIRKNEELLEAINSTASAKDGLFSHLSNINSKVEEASSNFKAMASSSSVISFDLSNAFGEKATSANSKLTDVFDAIKGGASAISDVIETLNQELHVLNTRIQELDSEIGRAQLMIDRYEESKHSSLANMAYYKRIAAPSAPLLSLG